MSIRVEILKRVPEIFYPFLLKIWYKLETGKTLDLEHPKSFNEKIQWLKLNDKNPLKTKYADKYLVKDFVKNTIGEEYVIPLLGVWDRFEDIDFDKLPEKFVLKTNNGCGTNIIVDDKSTFDKKSARKKINKWLKTNYAFQYGYEMQYNSIKPKIIAEEFIGKGKAPDDYKVWCFNGKVEYIQYLTDRDTELKMAFYDTNWHKQDFVYTYKKCDFEVPKPVNLELMINLASKLSQHFEHVRVDFYILPNNQIKFGEMTFTSCSGVSKWSDEDINLKLGSMIKLPIDEEVL
jgi:hypothetical protein